jgi:uridylate kinase
LLKLSGEALMGSLEYGTDPERVETITRQINEVAGRGVEIAVVVGAGNIYRGLAGAAEGMDRATADYMGMLATVLNALTLQDALEKLGTHTRVLSAIEIHAEAILMAKHGVEGVYDADPSEVPDAKFLPEITHMEALERGLRVMDSTALSLCMDNDLPIHVFNMADERNIDRILSGERVGTIVS